MNTTKQDMKRDWDERAQADPIDAIMGKPMPEDEYWRSGEEDYAAYIQPHISTLLEKTDGLTVLEIGCAMGRLLRPMSRQFGRVIGIDVSQVMVELATNLHPQAEYPNVSVLQGDGEGLGGVESDSIDLVVSHRVFQHMPSTDVVAANIREVGRVLRPSGGFVLDVPTLDGWLKLGGIPLVPRFLKPLTPPWMRALVHPASSLRPERRRSTWRGVSVTKTALKRTFADTGLTIEAFFQSGISTNRMAVGRRRGERS